MSVDAWREDPEGLGAMRESLGDFLVEMGMAEMDLPHIVLCRDSRGLTTSFSGPYSSVIEALVAADIEQQIESESDGPEAVTFHVAALYPALDPSPGEGGVRP